MKNIGEEIKRIIDLKGLKRRDLAHYLDMTEANVSKIYNKSSIDVSLLERVSNFLQVPVSYFFEKEENAGQKAHAEGDRSVAVAGDGNFFSGDSQQKKDTAGVNKDSETVKMLKQLLAEKDRLLVEKEKLLEEKERVIQLLMGKR